MTSRSSYKTAFTLVELNIAIVFVAFLLMAVAMTTISVSRTYQYGVALKSINQLGREVVDQMRRDLKTAAPQRIEYYDADAHGGVGRLCLGTVSYVFNAAAILESNDPSLIKDTTLSNKPIGLARIDDIDSSWCRQVAGAFTKTAITSADTYTEMLRDDSIPVAVHSMQAPANTLLGATGYVYAEALTEVIIDIGTNETATTDGGVCKPPTSPQENFNNCAVRQFVLVVHSVGG